MLELHDDGRAGGEFGHLAVTKQNTRKRRAAEVVADFAIQRSDRIRRAFEDGLADTESVAVRQATALHVLGVERQERELQLKEKDQEFRHMSKGELVDQILNGIAALSKAGEVPSTVVDATVVEQYELNGGDDDYDFDL
jgi:hypothetical protein